MKPAEIAAAKVIKILEEAQKNGTVHPFREFFRTGAFNGKTQQVYTSPMNQFSLGGEGEWLTIKQINEKGGKLKKGSKSNQVFGWGVHYVEVKDEDGNVVLDDDGNPKKEPRFRYKYDRVFNVLDTTLEPTLKTDSETDEIMEDVIMDYIDMSGIELIDDAQQAVPQLVGNTILTPKPQQFKSTEHYFATLCPLLIKSTRKHFDRKAGIQEDITAEIGASMLMGRFGISTDETDMNSIAHIQTWIDAIEDNKYVIIRAASAAAKAVKYICGEPDGEEE